MTLKKFIETLATVIFYLFLFWFIYQILLKLTGHSPTVETILATGLGTVIAFLLAATLKIGEFMGQTRSFMENTKESFRRIREDMKELNQKIKK